MATAEDRMRARRLRRYLEDLWIEGSFGRRHGFTTGVATLTGIKRGTVSSWFSETRPKEPQLPSLRVVAAKLNVSVVEIVAAMYGVDLLTKEQAHRMADQEFAKLVAAAQAEGLLPAPPRKPIGAPGGTPQRLSDVR